MASPQRNKRREMDVMKLLMSDWKVELVNDSTTEFEVEFYGPKESPYEGGVWKVRVELPDNYPYKSPSIGFKNRIYHPNVDEAAGSVCLDVINQTWSPMFDLINVFEVFLPQLLLYPNPADPLNGEAAALMLREPDQYKDKVREYVRRYATTRPSEELSSPATKDTSGSGQADGIKSSPSCDHARHGAVAAKIATPACCDEPFNDDDDDDGGGGLDGLLSDSD